ncbi:hypothetical protein A2U01_0063675, partial [Trifolium medium]|nr:hypothetical protein [Trifolium medium]
MWQRGTCGSRRLLHARGCADLATARVEA